MDINLIIVGFLSLWLIFINIVMFISNGNWYREYAKCRDEICTYKITIAELKTELKFMNGKNHE